MSWGLAIEEAVRFHGHLGLWLLMGCRAGEIAKSRLKPSNLHELHCIVRVPNGVPHSCSIDGVQASTSCTLGEGDIVVERGEGFEFAFINKASKEVLRLRVKKA